MSQVPDKPEDRPMFGDDETVPDSSAFPAGEGDRLLVFGADAVRAYPVPETGELHIGRSNHVDVCIKDPALSREHARLVFSPPSPADSGLRLVDLGSANGTRLRGERIDPETPYLFAPGDLIEVGRSTLVVQRSQALDQTPRRLLTHGYFELRVEEECQRARQTGTPFALVRIRTVGNASTEDIESAISSLLGPSDPISVYAADRYDVLIAGVDAAQAEEAVAGIRFGLGRLGLEASTRLVCYPADGHEAATLIDRLGGEPRTGSRVGVRTKTELILVDERMRQLYQLVDRVAGSDISVLVLGETGVGKEVIARTLHDRSRRKDRPFLALNCGAFTEQMLESELFGHERGAFTGAVKEKKGLLETAEGGSVFLDELGEMSLPTQVKLLRVIEDREFRRLGSVKSTPMNVRFISATNRDLARAITAGSFREDLFYRLNGISLQVPPLRERTAEIAAFVDNFAAAARAREGRSKDVSFTDSAMTILTSYAWPGNVRELKNVIEHAVVLAGDHTVGVEHLPMDKLTSAIVFSSPGAAPVPRAPSFGGGRRDFEETMRIEKRRESSIASLRDELDDLERERIMKTLEECGGNQSRAAKALGMSRQALIRRLDQYDIPRPRKGR